MEAHIAVEKERSCQDMPVSELHIRRLQSIAAGITALIEKENANGKADIDKIAGLYDCTLHVLESTEVPEARAAFELGYMMAKRGRSPELAAQVAARIWPDDEPHEETVERITRNINTLCSAT